MEVWLTLAVLCLGILTSFPLLSRRISALEADHTKLWETLLQLAKTQDAFMALRKAEEGRSRRNVF